MSRVLVIGPGPAVIGEGGELDAAAAEAVRTLRDRGHEVILVTSNPATVASDPTLADRTYLEPLDEPALRAIVAAEKPALVFPMFGGRKALALALALHDDGTLGAAGARLAGITAEALAAALADAGIAAAKRAALGADESWTSLEVVAAFDATGAFLPVVTIESLDRAGVHPGDAIGVTPPLHADAALMAEIHDAARAAILTAGLRAGIATCELAVRRSDRTVHALSVMPGATRSSALAAQATGVSAVRGRRRSRPRSHARRARRRGAGRTWRRREVATLRLRDVPRRRRGARRASQEPRRVARRRRDPRGRAP